MPKNNYHVELINAAGCHFDGEDFTNLKQARKWSSGRGQQYLNNKWCDYIVRIFKNNNGVPFLEYRTR